MTDLHLTWMDSLAEYLSLSNEDASLVSFFQRVAAPQLLTFLSGDAVKWLDIGTGPGTKLVGFADALSRIIDRDRIDITMIDPEFHNRCELKQSLNNDAQRFASHATSIGCTIQDFVDMRLPKSAAPFNFITSIHLLYSPALITPVLRVITDNASRSSVMTLLICEAVDSDFHKMRAELRQQGVDVANSVLNEVVGKLENAGFAVERFAVADQRCRVDRDRLMHDDSYWLFPFLVARTTSDYLADEKLRRAVCRTARTYISALERAELSVPDTAIIAVSRIGDR